MLCPLCLKNEASSTPICYECLGINTKVEAINLWTELHSYIYINAEQAREFYWLWTTKIPSFGCACKEHWADIIKELPPNFNSAREFFEWGVDAHNLVNKKLDTPLSPHPQFSYEEARALYKQDCV